MSGTNDDYRTGSADSENSSDSFVQVTKEDAPQQEPLLMDTDIPPISTDTISAAAIPAVDDTEDIYGAEESSPIPKDHEV